jgi:methyl-accepting chemotaxis protein
LSAASDGLAQISDRLVENGQTVSQGATAVAERTHEVSTNVEAVASAAIEATRNVSSVSSSTEQMSQNMAQVSLAAEAVASNAVEVEGSIRDISDAMATIRGNTEKAATVSRQGAEKATPVQQLLRELTQSAEATGKIVALIQKVADQTNLLSLNASIEAASAGDAGKGFAVVANEVKELAKETAAATDDIGQRIVAIQGDAQAAVIAIDEISAVIARISDIQNTIASAVEEQTATTNEITRHVTEAATGANEIAASITGVAQAAHDTSSGAASTQVSARDLAELADELNRSVTRFVVRSNGNGHAAPRAMAEAAPKVNFGR